MPIRIFVADDHQVVRDGIRYHIEKSSRLDWVGEAASGTGLAEKVTNAMPDVIILDLSMPDFDPVAFVVDCGINHPNIRILVLTVYDDPELAVTLIEAGAAGYLKKDAMAVDLIRAVESVANGKSWMDPQIGTALIHRQDPKTISRSLHLSEKLTSLHAPNSSRPSEAFVEELTAREREILTFLVSGASTVEIADSLNISRGTVQTHIKSIYSKINVNSRVEAVIHGAKYL